MIDPSVVEAAVESIVDEKSRLKASANLSGARNIVDWQYEDPEDGQIVVGVVLAFSMDSISTAAGLKASQNKRISSSSR